MKVRAVADHDHFYLMLDRNHSGPSAMISSKDGVEFIRLAHEDIYGIAEAIVREYPDLVLRMYESYVGRAFD